MAPTEIKTKVILAISILSFAKYFANGQYFVRADEAIISNHVGDFERIHLSYALEEQLDKLTKSISLLAKTMNFIMPAVTESLEQLKSLKNLVHQSHYQSAANRKDQQKSQLEILEVKCADDRLPENCYQVDECQKHIYSILIPNYSELAFPVSCDFKTESSGWTVIQRRQDGSVNFFRNWTEYAEGFGVLNGEFFIGLEKLHALTTQGVAQELYIILKDFEGELRYAKYKTFRIDSKENDYNLTVGNYTGNAGDSFSQHSGFKFSTLDRDNDVAKYNCAEKYHSGWWHHACGNSDLNGDYLTGIKANTSLNGIKWGTFHNINYSFKYTQMMIRPCKD